MHILIFHQIKLEIKLEDFLKALSDSLSLPFNSVLSFNNIFWGNFAYPIGILQLNKEILDKAMKVEEPTPEILAEMNAKLFEAVKDSLTVGFQRFLTQYESIRLLGFNKRASNDWCDVPP